MRDPNLCANDPTANEFATKKTFQNVLLYVYMLGFPPLNTRSRTWSTKSTRGAATQGAPNIGHVVPDLEAAERCRASGGASEAARRAE